MNHSIDRLGEVSRTYAQAAIEFKAICKAAAKAKGDFVKAKAIFKLTERSKTPEKLSDVELEMRAHAHDEIADLYQAHLDADAIKDSHYELLRQLKEQNANGRTIAVDEREVDKMHANNWAGAA